MAYSTSVDVSAIVDGQQIDAADVTTPIGNLKSAIEDLGNGVSAPEAFRMAQIATPSNPAASSNKIYFKSGDIPYYLTSGGIEKMVGGTQLITPRTALGAPATSMTTPTIPATFKHLYLVIEARTDVAATADSLLMRFNADSTAANYDHSTIFGNGSTVTASEAIGTAAGIILTLAAPGNTGTAGNGYAIVEITNYISTTVNRLAFFRCGEVAAVSSTNIKVSIGTGVWRNTSAAISTITILPNGGTNLATGSAYTLYGFN